MKAALKTPTPYHHVKELRKKIPVGAYLLPYAFALDFRGESGGSPIQYAMAIFAIMLIFWVLVSAGFKAQRELVPFLVLTFSVLMIGCASALIFDAVIFNAIRVSLPFFLFFFGTWVGGIVGEDRDTTWSFVRHCVFASLVSIAFRYVYATYIMGIHMDEMRYQLLSPALPFVLAYVVSSLLYGKGIQVVALLAAVMSLATIVLSVTRSFILSGGFAVLGWLFLLVWSRNRSLLLPRVDLWRAIGAFVGCVTTATGVYLAYIFRPDIFFNWWNRLFNARSSVDGQDITYLVRVAEAQGIWDAVSSSPFSVLIGRGFGNFYNWSDEYAEHVRRVSVAMLADFEGRWFASHSVFTYGLFFGGAFGLAWSCYLYWAPLARILKISRDLPIGVHPKSLQSLVTVYLTILMFLSQSITSNPFGERLSGLYLGLFVGLALSFNARILGGAARGTISATR